MTRDTGELIDGIDPVYGDGAELKPCPFCGGHPCVDVSKIQYWRSGSPFQSVRVHCLSAKCAVNPSVYANGHLIEGHPEARSKAIAAWNRRAPVKP